MEESTLLWSIETNYITRVNIIILNAYLCVSDHDNSPKKPNYFKPISHYKVWQNYRCWWHNSKYPAWNKSFL